jgi:hypothetical protein
MAHDASVERKKDSRTFVARVIDDCVGFVAVSSVECHKSIEFLPIDQWECSDGKTYTVVSVLYSQQRAAEMLKDDRIMAGPDMYQVFLSTHEECHTLQANLRMVAWQPRFVPNLIELSGYPEGGDSRARTRYKIDTTGKSGAEIGTALLKGWETLTKTTVTKRSNDMPLPWRLHTPVTKTNKEKVKR